MKNTVFFLLFACSVMRIEAQQNLGVRNGNYSGIQGALLNPSSIADPKLKWDVNILSGDVVFDNSFLYASKGNYPLFGFKRVIKGSIDENLFGTRYDPMDPKPAYVAIVLRSCTAADRAGRKVPVLLQKTLMNTKK